MAAIVILVHTWRCPDCNYVQDFDPNDAKEMARHFPDEGSQKYPVGDCPACTSGQNPSHTKMTVKMAKVTDPAMKTKVTVADVATLDAGVDMRSDEIVDHYYQLEAKINIDYEENAGVNLLSRGEKDRRMKAWIDARVGEIAQAKAQRLIDNKVEMDEEKAALRVQRTNSLKRARLDEDTG